MLPRMSDRPSSPPAAVAAPVEPAEVLVGAPHDASAEDAAGLSAAPEEASGQEPAVDRRGEAGAGADVDEEGDGADGAEAGDGEGDERAEGDGGEADEEADGAESEDGETDEDGEGDEPEDGEADEDGEGDEGGEGADDGEGAEEDGEPRRGRGRLSYRERREQSDALGRLARILVDDLTPSQLAEVQLPDEVRVEIEKCRDFRKGARVRQLRRIGQLLRRLDVDAVTEATADAGNKQRRRAQRERIYEHWRERLLEEGDDALAELLDEHPTLDRQRLRQLVRRAQRDPESDRAKQASRAVLRMVRDVLESTSE